ncbi:P-loop containing nucleoside triphosphate hydrolase domain-containing protein [Strongyloides ratti]|uniref:P-loop containing Nucleoside triphosphate hydrolase domain-containing protein n=1 Tax=Strongyloides ratti TaxID=34506 RepID=A0A090LAB0_STRRB|nr:P-loop containing nucleoside triphosphate hydrolase domain-containing protein [Strongyloides ratti]CEF64470.1 P-loop containing nucleoside triphosphate hydrolase domain-containing protein [Strongyloides ratti]
MGEKKKISKKKSEKKKGLPNKESTSKRIEVKKEEPKYEIKTCLDPRIVGAITSLSLSYQDIVKPIIEHHNYNIITNTVPILPNCIISKPTILVLGTNGSGKTSLINYFLNDDEGYIKKCEALKSNLQNFTHLTNGLSNFFTPPAGASNNPMWQFNNTMSLCKENEGGQIQLVTLQHPLLSEINFIDSPNIPKNLGETSKDEIGYIRILNCLFDRVDLIFFIGTPQTLKEPIGKILDELNKVSYKTIFLLNKSDENKNEKDFKKAKEAYKNFLKKSIKDGNLSIFQTCLDKKTHSDKSIQDLIQADMNIITERISKLPITYKITRITTIMQNAMSVFFISVIQNELNKRSIRQFAHIAIKPNEFLQFGQEFLEINGGEKFFAENKDLIAKSYTLLERTKWNAFLPNKNEEIKKFITKDIPYLLTCASDEPEVTIKYALPGISKNDNDKPSIVVAPTKKKVIKEIKIDIPQDDENEDDEDGEEASKIGSKEGEGSSDKKETKGKQKKIKQIKLNQAVIDQLNK